MTDRDELSGWMRALRRDFHRQPEFGFEESRTASVVAEALRELGWDVVTGVGGTGVVACGAASTNTLDETVHGMQEHGCEPQQHRQPCRSLQGLRR